MGSCISSQMERSNNKKMVDFAPYRDFSAYGKQATALPDTETAEHSATFRMANTSPTEYEKLKKEWYSGGSCLGLVQKMAKERSSKVCLAYRTLNRVEKEDVTDANGRTKTFEYYVFDTKHQTMSYDLFWKNIIGFGRGLQEIGLKRGDTVAIYEETRWQWLTTMYACWSQGITVATVYANLGEDALLYALKETACDAIVCGSHNIKNVFDIIRKGGMARSTKVIYLDQIAANFDAGDTEVYRWGDVMLQGRASSAEYSVPGPENADEQALIMYTSGTTGNPKGVMHTHGSLYCGVMTIAQRVEDLLGPIAEEEWYCSYLPLAHIMEFAVTSVLMLRGVVIGYGSPRTLTDQFARPHGDLTEYRPRLLVAVPRVFDSIKKGVEAKLPAPGTLRRNIFDNAYRARLQALKDGKDTPYYNKKVFGVPRQAMGGQVYAMLNGGGPLSEATQEFINVVFGMVVQGWGLTETVCVGGIQRTGNLQYGNVGQILKTEELRLLDTADYKHTDKPEPRGEICLRGPFLFKGYYKQPELTKEALDDDGWFHTGDVGALADNGTIKIVGRVKALAKNALGEYVSMEQLEAIYGTNRLVTPGCVCVLVHPHRAYIALIGLTTEAAVEAFKVEHNLTGSYPAILEDAAFNKALLQSLAASAKAAKLKSFETVKQARLLADEWTPENGVLTAALKLRRKVIEDRYKDLIEELFKEE